MALNLIKPKPRPLIYTIAGEPGSGKTSLGALFPRPVFVLVEDGTQSIQGQDVACFERATSFDMVLDQLRALYTEENHGFQTVVIDSVTALNRLIEAEVLESDKKAKSLAKVAGGYGAGYQCVANLHRKIREACGYLNEKGMAIVFLAHVVFETVNPPDGPEYSRYTLAMHKLSAPYYVDESDVVGFIRLNRVVVDDKAVAHGGRTIIVTPNPAFVSKNRVGFEADLQFHKGQNPFLRGEK